MTEQDILARLRRSLARSDVNEWADMSMSDRFMLGVDAVDAPLGGGLPRNAIHEVFASEASDSGAACGFGLGVAMRMAVKGRTIVWVQQAMAVREYGGLYPRGLVELGASPSIILVEVRDTVQGLRAAHEALQCVALGGVVLELWGETKTLDLSASRRLSRAAATSRVGLVMLHLDAKPQPSAAFSRWSVAASPSAAFEAGAPGHPCFNLTLLRHRGGLRHGQWRVEWNRDDLVFRETTLSGAVVSLPAHRPAQPFEWQRMG